MFIRPMARVLVIPDLMFVAGAIWIFPIKIASQLGRLSKCIGHEPLFLENVVAFWHKL